jgi:hypothetical protein
MTKSGFHGKPCTTIRAANFYYYRFFACISQTKQTFATAIISVNNFFKMGSSHNGHHRLSTAGILITLGIIFGDIGTSPLYVMKAVIGEGKIIDAGTVLGGVSTCLLDTHYPDNH